MICNLRLGLLPISSLNFSCLFCNKLCSGCFIERSSHLHWAKQSYPGVDVQLCPNVSVYQSPLGLFHYVSSFPLFSLCLNIGSYSGNCFCLCIRLCLSFCSGSGKRNGLSTPSNFWVYNSGRSTSRRWGFRFGLFHGCFSRGRCGCWSKGPSRLETEESSGSSLGASSKCSDPVSIKVLVGDRLGRKSQTFSLSSTCFGFGTGTILFVQQIPESEKGEKVPCEQVCD